MSEVIVIPAGEPLEGYVKDGRLTAKAAAEFNRQRCPYRDAPPPVPDGLRALVADIARREGWDDPDDD